jgi:two-component system sensor histidine kinase/response regulator
MTGAENDALLALLIAETHDYAILMLDADGRVTTWNAGAHRFKGYKADEIIGQHFSVFYPPEDIAAGKPAQELALALAEGRMEDEGWRLRKDGTRFWANVVITTLRGPDGTVLGFGKVTRDLTERRLADDELVAAHERAVEASRAKSAFVANMSHEIRTPLNGVIGMAGLLLDTDLDGEQREYVNAVRASGDALMAVIEDILDFSKIEAGKLELDKRVFDVRELVESACTMLATSADDKGLELMTWIDDGVKPVACGDGARLRQILVNLLTNAIKFTATGEIVVRVSKHRDAERPGLRFEVSDTGIGIEQSTIERIFDSFAQGDCSTTRRYGGTGLGLAISRRLVELMGGQMGVDSTPGEGSTFWFTVAVDEVQSDNGATRPVGIANVRTLVVDDNRTNRTILEHQLESWGMTCTTAADARAALLILRAAEHTGRPYHLVVLDAKMPHMTGLELAVAIKSDRALCETRLLMLTSSGSGRAAAIEAGIDGFVTKPVRRSRLRDEILLVLDATATSSEPERAFTGPLAETTQTRRRLSVLLADDIPVNQLVAQRLLEKRGCDVDIAADGEEAVDMHGRSDYEVIFMDCQMPLLDGYEATAEIRRREGSGRHTPIVAMTANTMKGDRERCLAAGMDDYLAKPLEPALLDEMLNRMLRASEDPPDVDGMSAPAGDGEPADELPVLDADPLAEICGGDDDARDMLVAMFVDQATAAVTTLGHALQTNDLQGARLSAHALTGSSATLGARRLAAVARRICEDITSGHPTDASAGHAELQHVLALTLAAFRPDAAQQPQIASSDPV